MLNEDWCLSSSGSQVHHLGQVPVVADENEQLTKVLLSTFNVSIVITSFVCITK